MKCSKRTLAKHIFPLFPEITTRTRETRVWRPPEIQGTKTVARNVFCTGIYGEHKRGETRNHF